MVGAKIICVFHLPIELPIELRIELPVEFPIELLIESAIELGCLVDTFWQLFHVFRTPFGCFVDAFWMPWAGLLDPGTPVWPKECQKYKESFFWILC